MQSFTFHYSNSAKISHFCKTAEKLSNDGSVSLDLKELSEKGREAAVTINPAIAQTNATSSIFVGTFDELPTISQIEEYLINKASEILADRKAKADQLEADTIAQTLIVEQIEALSDDDRIESLEASGLKSWQCVKSLRDRLAAIESRSAAIVKAREIAAKEAIKVERLTWIENHGSDRLKRATSSGYNCQRLYVEERAALEYPEFDLDYADNLSTQGRSCPSVNALDELDRYPLGRIVWVKERHDRDEEYYEDDYDGEEAIVIGDYLGNYTLVKYLGDPQE